MHPRILLIALLGLITTACVPYGGSGYYRTQYYTADRYVYPGYYRPAYPYNRGYYVAPQPRHYYSPPVRYYRPAPVPHYKPYPPPGVNRHWQDGPRYDHRYNSDRQRYDYGRDRNRHDYRNDRRYQDDRSLHGQRRDGRPANRNWQR
ncbi:hypothetical protein ACYU03_05835 [Pseudomonas sp. X10]